MTQQWKEIGGGLNVDRTFPAKDVILQIGDAVEGRYIDKIEGIGDNNSTVYVLEEKDGSKTGVWSSTVLDNRFKRIAIGKMLRVEYIGKEKGKSGRTFKNFKVFEGIDTPGDE